VILKEVLVLVKFKKLHEDAVLPKYSKQGDAALDLSTVDDGRYVESSRNSFQKVENGDEYSNEYAYLEYDTGLSVEIEHGFVGLIFPRSSISETGLTLRNSCGVIDSGYRGSIKFRFRKDFGSKYRKGDRIGQLIIIPYPTLSPIWADELSETVRGDSGFGSSGK
jgi:dUTP pyrophosphatase